MVEFYQSIGGRRFIDGTCVKIADSLVSIAQSLERVVVATESQRASERVELPFDREDIELLVNLLAWCIDAWPRDAARARALREMLKNVVATAEGATP